MHAKISQEPGTKGTVCGHDFIWTAQHPQLPDIQKLLYTYDKLATDSLDVLDEISPPGPKDGRKCPMSQRDLYSLLQEHHEKDETLHALWSEINTVPDWVDWERIERGQQLVYQYHGQMLLGLLFNSLLGGMAAWRVVETLARTGGFGVQVTRRRLLETSQHFLECIEDIDAVKPGGRGYVSSVRVRLLHASVRRRIMRLAKEKPDYYDTEAWGVPINDLHQLGTIDAYSTALVYMSLPRQGIYLTEEQTMDYLALWRWIGYIMGTPVEWMESPSRAKAMMESVMTSELGPSKNSKIIANNILTAQTNVPPLSSSREYLAALTYKLNGDCLASSLGIDKPGAYYNVLASLQCTILNTISAIHPRMPKSWQERKTKRFIEYGHEMIRSQRLGGIGHSAKFDFQYTPAIGKMTELGAFGEPSTPRGVLATILLFVALMVTVWLSNMVYPWQTTFAQRLAMVIPAEQVLSKLQ